MSFLTGGSKQTSTSSNNSSNQAYGAVSNASTPYISAGSGATSLLNRLLGIGNPVQPNQPTFQPYGSDGFGYGLPGTPAVTGWSPIWNRMDAKDIGDISAGMYSPIPGGYSGGFQGYGMTNYSPQPQSLSNEDAGNAMQSWLDNSGYSWVRDQGNKGLEGTYASKSVPSSGAAMKALVKFNSGLANTYLQQYIGNLQDQQKLGIGALGVLSSAGQQSSSTSSSSGKSSNGLLGGIGGLLSGIGAL